MVDQSVKLLWSRSLHLRSSSETMAAASDALVVAERHSRLTRLDPVSGESLWEQRVEDCWGTTVVAGEKCLYLSQAGVLHCFDLHNGEQMWSTPGPRLLHYVSVSGSVILLGGWRGYHPLKRVSLADGEPLPPVSTALPHGSQLAWPLPLRLAPERDLATHAALIAIADKPELLLLDSQSGTVVAEWPLPAPVVFPDTGIAYDVSDDGRIIFLSGRRTIMAFHPVDGVKVLWQHERDLLPHPPMLRGGALWLVEDTGITFVDLDRGAVTEVAHLPRGAVSAAAPISGGALFAYPDGSLVSVDRVGHVNASLRIPARIDRLLPGGSDLVHAIGTGHLVTLNLVTPGREDSGADHERRVEV
ncbi:PQQ-binding-like beta-propeller repeat protein [Micromonospora sp. NPDC051006]|uniref:outer membrane protein assembly factor BamB family protein n=1 Tax=Micromonospora sp. NPDC051006 TaxID=3364283 RepID=UPI0037947C68